MIDQPAYVKVLLQKYLEGTAAPVELGRLMAAWDIYDDDELAAMIAEVTGDGTINETEKRESDVPGEKFPEQQQEATQPINKSGKKGSRFDRLFSNSSYLLLAASIIWFFVKPSKQPSPVLCDGIPVNTELSTASNYCRLVLANGSPIVIDSTMKGLITQEGDLVLTQPEPGLLVYQQTNGDDKNSVTGQYHTIETEPGQQYKVVLPDGTNLRLNAASSIRFSVDVNQQRIIYLKGEALFDIAPGNTAPFVVYTGNAAITLQQAKLNVKAYAQQTVATLLKGNMAIKAGADSAQLTAGNIATAVATAKQVTPKITLMKVDSLSAISWTKTTRVYKDASMREFVTDIGRWYNLEIVNLGCIPSSARIGIVICSNTPMERVLEIFTDHKLKFYKVGNKITFCNPTLNPAPAKSIPFK